jgi:XrtJ-associated TM-motif-TM protein
MAGVCTQILKLRKPSRVAAMSHVRITKHNITGGSLSVGHGLPVYHIDSLYRVYSHPIFIMRGLMILHTRLRYSLFGLALLAAPFLHAQSGCVNSPENPTVVLGLIGIAGALVIPVKNRLASFRRSRKNK